MPPNYNRIVESIRQAALIADRTPNHPEAKLRELVAPLWDEYVRAKRINLTFQPRDERILANGRADTVFNRLILEYKKPGVIKPDNARNRQLIAQVKGYIEDLAKEERWKQERLLGVAFDGNYFLYVRKVGRWIEEDPVPVSAESVERFLLTLEKLTTKAALVPDNLIRDFAIGGDARNFIASNAIRAFYFALKDGVNERVKVFFEQWALQFAEVHGAIENKKFDAQTLFESYGFKRQEQTNFDFLAFFFALDTYYGLLMKLLAYQVVGFYTLKDIAGLPLADWEKLENDALKEKLAELEEGGIFRSLGIRNFLEGDLLSWYLNDWDNAIEQAIRAIIERLNQYDPETLELVPDETRDILKKLYQFLVPKQIRHDLGEYYTPDWLAERVLNQVGYGVRERDLLNKRLLDPGCGSGTFVILAIKRAKEHARLNDLAPAETLRQITQNIVGFDLNPLAVISARTNYLLAVADLLKHKRGEITIPIYLCDSINPPRAQEQTSLFDVHETGMYIVPTSVGRFRIPQTLVQRDLIRAATNLLEDSVKRDLSVEKFLERARAELKVTDLAGLGETYAQLLELERKGINGIWARIIKNAFAPLFVGQFDFIAGNPPWVNWEALPGSYRDVLLPINHTTYKLFLHSGLAARHGAAKIDLCSLMFYVSADKYLKANGKLCFVVTQTLFQSAGGSKGFRQFFIHPTKTPLKVEQVDDFVELQPFDSATNRTAVISVLKGAETKYPVPYLRWRKTAKGSIPIDLSFDEVMSVTKRAQHYATPIDRTDRFSSWICARREALSSISNAVGQSHYEAHEGANTGGANGVYWVEITGKHGKNPVISNLYNSGKRKVDPITTEIEPVFLYPLLRGRDVKRWNANPEYYVVVPQKLNDPKEAVDERTLSKNYPKTYDYFLKFKNALAERKSQVIRDLADSQAFYFIYAVKAYTLAPYKVVWSELGVNVEAAVTASRHHPTLGSKIIIPDHTVVAISFDDLDEAHYVCALLNSSPSLFIIKGYVALHPSPHILNNIKIPEYDKGNDTHHELARLSKKCHEKTAAGIDVSDLEEQIDELAAELWGLTKEELKEIKESLEEMR